jgi:hypothetical protein
MALNGAICVLAECANCGAGQPTTQPGGGLGAGKWLHMPRHWPGQHDLLQWTEQLGAGTAAVLVLLGIVYLLFGFYLFRFLIVANVAIVGAAVGALAGDRGGGHALPGGVLGGFVSAVVTWPLIKGAVTFMGALFGALVGATVWRLAGLEPGYAWSGALTGLVACTLVCFLAFRESLMAYTSLQGSVMLVFGVLALAMKYQTMATSVTDCFSRQTLVLPTLILIPTVVGTLFQRATNGAEPSAAAASAPAEKPKK